MKLIVAGSRTIDVDGEFIRACMHAFGISGVKEIVSGGCTTGPDWAGEQYSIDHLDKNAKVFNADWSQGLGAGPARNADMAKYGDALLLIWDGRSTGSASMKREMLALKKPIYEIVLNKPKD